MTTLSGVWYWVDRRTGEERSAVRGVCVFCAVKFCPECVGCACEKTPCNCDRGHRE